MLPRVAGRDLTYTCALQLSGKSLSWQWSLEVENTTDGAVEADIICVQDVGLKPAELRIDKRILR